MQNQNELNPKSQSLSYPKSLGEILNQSHSLEASTSTSNESKGNSLTITSPKERQGQIGKPLSEHGLTELRNMAQSVQQGQLLDDKKLETLLAQHFGSSRLEIKPIIDHNYSDGGGYKTTVLGHEITLDRLDDSEMKLFDAVDFFNRPSTPEYLAKYLARLSTVMARRSESNQDIAVLIDTYADRLAEYPPDVIKAVFDEIIDGKKWFPLVVEVKERAEELVSFRRNLLKCFEECRNPLLQKQKRVKQIESDARFMQHWKSLKRESWLEQHYIWWIEDAEDMINLAKKHPTNFKLKEWEDELKRRNEELNKFRNR